MQTDRRRQMDGRTNRRTDLLFISGINRQASLYTSIIGTPHIFAKHVLIRPPAVLLGEKQSTRMFSVSEILALWKELSVVPTLRLTYNVSNDLETLFSLKVSKSVSETLGRINLSRGISEMFVFSPLP